MNYYTLDTPVFGHQQDRKYNLWADTGCRLEDQQEVMGDRDGWWEHAREIDS